MGLKKIFIRVACILCILSAVFALPGCGEKRIGRYLMDLTDKNRPPYDVVLFSYEKKATVKNLIRFGRDFDDWENISENMNIFSAYFDGNLYSVYYRSDDYRNLNVHIYVITNDGKLIDDVYVGNFGPNGENTEDRSYPMLYDVSLYYNKSSFDEASNAIPMPDHVLTTYSNGCIYVCDANKSAKYDIKKDEIIENPEEAAEVFAINYIHETSEDGNTLYITNLNTNEKKEITIEKIAETCPEIKEFLDIYGDKKVFVDGVDVTAFAFQDSFSGRHNYMRLKVIDGELFITLHLVNRFPFSFPVVLKFDFEAETFEFCVAGDDNTAFVPIPIIK